jgi:hypothetical protein
MPRLRWPPAVTVAPKHMIVVLSKGGMVTLSTVRSLAVREERRQW